VLGLLGLRGGCRSGGKSRAGCGSLVKIKIFDTGDTGEHRVSQLEDETHSLILEQREGQRVEPACAAAGW
jgi:hypothetical protein